ncbi:hypothetical protein INS49_007959 [Diaporthe citri]|uniref:uncharacterized protein n=1 Tax=Diaporthe citri TaxID=83186 RepID=UPI001C82382C|nr:uncharacterized protein INS49_007959 [Diaporthe citri]KAG6362864.1 hypothetical protein INS49_007959 [Diaporthe citri]
MAGQYPVHEGLQVTGSGHTSHAPEVYRYHDAAPETAPQGYVSPEKPASHQESQPLAAHQPRRWCGLPKRTALLIAAVVLLVIIGAVVGGVVGALVARNGTSNSSSGSSASATTGASSAADAAATSASSATASASASASAASTSPTSKSTSTSTSSVFPIPTNNILPLNCPAINNTQFTVQGDNFLVYCLTDFRTGSENIAQSLQPSISDCIGSCVTYNSEHENTDSPCQGLTFGANLTQFGGVNCFLKTGPLTKVPYKADSQAGALLLG